MKEKIIAAIKAKFPAINLSKARLEAIAARIETEVIDDETKIDAQLDVFNKWNPIADMAKHDDTVRDLKSKVKTATAPPKDKDTEKPDDNVDPDTPAWAKGLIESNKTLAQELQTLKAEKNQSTIRKAATERLKDVPASYWGKRPIPEKAEELDAFVAEVQTDYGEFKKEMVNQGLSVFSQPRSGTGTNGGAQTQKQVSPEVKKFIETQKAAIAGQQPAANNGAHTHFINTPKAL